MMLVVLFAVIFTLSACNKQSGNTDNTGGANFDNQGRRMPDFGQPEAPADIRGLVTSVVGNEVTILKIDRPQMGMGENSNLEEGEEPKASAIGTGSGGRMPGMGGGSRSSGADADSQAAMLERMKEMSTGEEKIIFPVGIQMLKAELGVGDTPTMVEANLGDVKIDKMLNVWLNEDVTDRKVASFVLVTR